MRYGANVLRFNTGAGECVVLEVLDYATTKVRRYGSAYRVDDHHTKQAKGAAAEVESLVPKLFTKKRSNSTGGILVIAHFRDPKELQNILGRNTDTHFLSHYQISHFSREWEDRFKRDFRTALHLWTCPAKTSPRLHSG